MQLTFIEGDFSICLVEDYSQTDLSQPYCFTGATEEENSLVCLTSAVPVNTIKRDDGWCLMKIEGILDFSLIGILAPIATVLADAKIGIFVVSTFNTDYILIKTINKTKAIAVLEEAGYHIQ